MKKKVKTFSIGLILLGLMTGSVWAKEVKKEFNAVKKVEINLILSDCRLVASPDSKIHVKINYTYNDDAYELRFRERGSRLYMKESFSQDAHDGSATWQVSIPAGIEVDIETATGDVTMKGLEKVELEGNSGTGQLELTESSGEFKLNSGTGDINVSDSQGLFDLNSGTGDVEINKAHGEFETNSGTGSVTAEQITIEDEAEFNSGTGEAKVVHPLGEDYDLTISSGTDDAILDMDGLPIKGYFEFTANNRRGDIVCPVKFDREDIYENGDGDYQRKSFTRGNDKQRYFISTGTGDAELKK